jgi:LPXTG-motif cell wall-anchored protein
MPDLPEAQDQFGMMWFENEYVIDTAAKWVVVGNAITALLVEDPSEWPDPWPSLAVGQDQAVDGHGFVPGEVVTATMNSDPVVIGTQVANTTGDVRFEWVIPAGTTTGGHSVTLSAPSGTVSASFQVVASGGDLGTTGADVTVWGLIGGLLLVCGGVVLLGARRQELGGHIS